MLYGVVKKPDLNHTKKKKYVMVAFFSLMLISMLRSYNVGRDLQSHYYNTFLRVVNIDWNYLYTLGYENGYLAFYKLISLFTDDGQWMIAIHAFIVIGITGWVIYRNSENVVMSTFLFITTNAWFMYMNIMRQAMAICIVLIGLEILKKKEWKYKRYVLYVLIAVVAMQFHSSAFVAFFIPVFNLIPFKRGSILISIVVMIASFALADKLFGAMSLFQIGKRDYTDFYSSSGEAFNIISLYFVLIYVMFFILGAISLIDEKSRSENTNETRIITHYYYSNRFLLYMVLALVVFRICGMKIIIMARMSHYFLPFTFILLPRAMNSIHGTKNRVIIKNTIYTIMTLAFIWMSYKSAAVLYGTVPYQFFWEI